MAQTRASASARREGFDCRLLAGGDNEALNSITAARIEALLHLGLTLDRAALLAGLIWEGRNHG